MTEDALSMRCKSWKVKRKKKIEIELSVELLVKWCINIFVSIRRATYERGSMVFHEQS